MDRAEAVSRGAVWSRAVVVCSAVAALASCGGTDFENHPPEPKLSGASDFASVPVGTSKRLIVFLGNGEIGVETWETLRGIAITVEGPDLSFDTNCPASLPQASVCAIDLVWTPSSTYELSGQVRVLSNAPTSPTTLALSGTAVR